MMSQHEMTDEMCRRVGLDTRIGTRILANAHIMRIRKGIPINMEVIAKAIKYVSENRQHLNWTYRQ